MYILKGRENYENSDTRQYRHHGQSQRLRRAAYSAHFPLKKRASCCAKHTITASAFSTPHAAYSDSEYKIGQALADVRDDIIIATKTASTTVEGFWKDLETSLSMLKTDHVDIYQFHTPSFCPKPGDGTGLYEAMLEAKAQGKIRHIGITIIACMWRAKPWNPACMKRCSSRSATLRAKRTLSS